MKALSHPLRALAALALLAAVSFSQDKPLRVTWALLFDGSRSVGQDFAAVKDAGAATLGAMRPGEEAAVIRFVSSADIKIIQDFTGDRAALREGVESLHTDYGQSAVVDGLYLAAEEVAKRAGRAGRAAVVVVTDGDERNSFYTPDGLIKLTRETGVRVYAIGLTAELKKDRRKKAESLLAKIARESRGRAFFPLSAAELPGIATEVGRLARESP